MSRSPMLALLVVVLAVAFGGCATLMTGPRYESVDVSTADVAVVAAPADTAAPATDTPALATDTPVPATDTPAPASDEPVLAATEYRLVAADDASASVLVAQAGAARSPAADPVDEEYDPWEPFNEKMFEFNRRLDRYVLKPVATAYNYVVPDRVQIMIANGFDNISFVPRMMNSLFQGKFDGAVREFGRFLFNSTVGIGGLFDVAKMEGIEKSREDFGQTLGFYGVGPGPYLILPFLEPLTVRDGVGKAVDGVMDPLSYFVPFFYTRLILKVEEIVNDRSLNLELFQGFEESVIDMYSAVRHGYLKRREKLIQE